uniref:Uncharacterized protein n=1 Tax=Clastoptera arizonana TaxID=38151 RepID=A0A1B6E3A0_9HEMI
MVEEMSSDDLKEIIKKLQAAAKCSVCLGCVRPPVQMCENGHMICSVCKPAAECNGDICPYCKSDFIDIKCVHMNTILSALPKDHNTDCNSAFCEGENHSSVCEKRMVVCRIINCSKKMPFALLVNHLKQEHKNISLLEGKAWTLGHYTQVIQNITESHTYVSPLLAHGCFFWKVTKIDHLKQLIMMFLVSLPTHSDHLKMVSVIKFTNDEKEISYSQKVWEEDVEFENIFEDVTCISVPFNMINFLVSKNNCINYNCDIIKFDKISFDKFSL